MFVVPTFRLGLQMNPKKVSHDKNPIEEKQLYATQQTSIFNMLTSVPPPPNYSIFNLKLIWLWFFFNITFITERKKIQHLIRIINILSLKRVTVNKFNSLLRLLHHIQSQTSIYASILPGLIVKTNSANLYFGFL